MVVVGILCRMNSGFQIVTKPKSPHRLQVSTHEGLGRTLWNLEFLAAPIYRAALYRSVPLNFPHGQVCLELTLPFHLWADNSESWDADTSMSYSGTSKSPWPHPISIEHAWDFKSCMFTFDLPSLTHNSLSRMFSLSECECDMEGDCRARTPDDHKKSRREIRQS